MEGSNPAVPESKVAREEDVASTSKPAWERRNTPDAGARSIPVADVVPFLQNLFVMRHGERMDDADESWVRTALRRWDPPVTEKGKYQAWAAGKRLRNEGWNITRVLVSPFLRCVQTAVEVVTALCLVDGTSCNARNSREAREIDPNRVKVSFEYGLCELMNARAIRNAPLDPSASGTPPPRSTPWHLPFAELSAMFPAGTLDDTVSTIWPHVPTWRESTADAHQRYTSTFLSAANMFVNENILCISHGQAVGSAVAEFQFLVYAVDYCAHAHVQRPVYDYALDGSLVAGDWDLLTESGPTGVLYGKYDN